jgi:distribution and morphology protein 34
MAFRFQWPEFDQEFYKEASSQLEAALNKGNKPKNIVDHITVKELNMGTTVNIALKYTTTNNNNNHFI